ncbi:MAG: pirin family protein [Alphaproteobacteria bacterium]
MTMKVHRSSERGTNSIEWLKSWHTFSFGRFVDRERMGFRSLRVINEDIVAPTGGFHTHPHDNMEIITYIVDGALEHKDSMGTGSVIRPGEIQKMSAGTGIEHSEFNPSKDSPVHLLQIWLFPDEKNVKPDYQQKQIDFSQGDLVEIAGPVESEQTVGIHQDAKIFASRPQDGKKISYALKSGRHSFVQVVKGAIAVNDNHLEAGDGIQISDVQNLDITASGDAEFLLFDLA